MKGWLAGLGQPSGLAVRGEVDGLLEAVEEMRDRRADDLFGAVDGELLGGFELGVLVALLVDGQVFRDRGMDHVHVCLGAVGGKVRAVAVEPLAVGRGEAVPIDEVDVLVAFVSPIQDVVLRVLISQMRLSAPTAPINVSSCSSVATPLVPSANTTMPPTMF